MGALTPTLGLYKPGGGSSGVITPDEIVDVDKLNENSDLIDAEAASVRAALAAQVARNQQFSGPAASKGSVAGMKRGDTYQETDGTYPNFFVYDGTNWKNRTRARAQLVSALSTINGSNFADWSGASAGFVYQEGGVFWVSPTPGPGDLEDVLIPYTGRWRISYSVRTNGVVPLTIDMFRNGTVVANEPSASGTGAAGAGSHAQKTFDMELTAADKLTLRCTSTGVASTRWLITLEYLGEI